MLALTLSCLSFASGPPAHAFDPVNSSNYSVARALLFAQFSAAAYCDADEISAWSCRPCQAADPGFTAKAFTNASTSMQAFVGAGSGYVVVAFRGTSDLQDWLFDLQFPKVTAYPKCDRKVQGDCRVEEGFYKAWLSLAPGIVDEVKRLVALQRGSGVQLFVTGHSLGAAMAAHCAAELGASSHSLGFPVTGVYTYGQPRVGNEDFARFYMSGTRVSWRLTHHRDPVPHLPTAAMGFHHIGTEIFYSEDSSHFVVCDGTGEDGSCSNRFYADTSIADHLTYLKPALGGDISRLC